MHYKSFIFWSITSILKTVSFNFDGKKKLSVGNLMKQWNYLRNMVLNTCLTIKFQHFILYRNWQFRK